jgi:hypothetical protein
MQMLYHIKCLSYILRNIKRLISNIKSEKKDTEAEYFLKLILFYPLITV